MGNIPEEKLGNALLSLRRYCQSGQAVDAQDAGANFPKQAPAQGSPASNPPQIELRAALVLGPDA